MKKTLKWNRNFLQVVIKIPNNQIHLTVKSVTPFAVAKAPPLFTSSDLGVRFLEGTAMWEDYESYYVREDALKILKRSVTKVAAECNIETRVLGGLLKFTPIGVYVGKLAMSL